MFLKQANSYSENNIKNNKKKSNEKNHIQRHVETGKDVFWKVPEKHGQREWITSLKKYTVFIFKRQGYFFLNKKVRFLANGGQSPLPGPSLRMQVFFSGSLSQEQLV